MVHHIASFLLPFDQVGHRPFAPFIARYPLDDAEREMSETMEAVTSQGRPVVVIYPNNDAGGRRAMNIIKTCDDGCPPRVLGARNSVIELSSECSKLSLRNSSQTEC